MKSFALLALAFLLTGCAMGTPPAAGHIYTDPINTAVSNAQAHLAKAAPVIDKANQSGSKAGDLKVASTDIHAAQSTLNAVPAYVTQVNKVIDDAGKTITKQNVTIAKQHAFILKVDCVLAGIGVCILGWAFIEFGLPLLKLASI